jgi:adenylate cyclase
MERRLAAILAADVVGYSRLMEQNEADTFERLRMHRKELFEPEIEKHHGRVFKLMGDGLLAEFGSVVDAVECAVTLQRGMAERNTATPEDRRIDVRIGVNLGDVIVEGDDRHGEGVNIAARLEGLAEPGGIVISGTAYDHVKTKVAVGYSYVGEQSVKNIIEPVRTYRVLLDSAAAGKTIGERTATLRPWRWPAVAVLVAAIAAGAVFWWRPWDPRFEPASIERMALPLPDTPGFLRLRQRNHHRDVALRR